MPRHTTPASPRPGTGAAARPATAPRRTRLTPPWRRQQAAVPMKVLPLTAPVTSLPGIDASAAIADAERRVREAVAKGAVDGAHGELVDRLVADLADLWRGELQVAYDEGLTNADESRRELIAMRSQLTDSVADLATRVARATAEQAAAWCELVGDDLAVITTATATDVTGLLVTPAALDTTPVPPDLRVTPATAPGNRRPDATDVPFA